jgi:hypothetical protein
MLQQGAETAKTLGDIPSGDDSALAALAAASQ